MEIPINAEVHCTDGVIGHSIAITFNPVTSAITHLAVKTKGFQHDEYLIPLDVVTETSHNTIQLRISKAEVTNYPPFLKHTFKVEESAGDIAMQTENTTYYWPYAKQDAPYYQTHGSKISHYDVEQIPHDELAVHKGDKVHATDGHVGQVDEFLINPENSHITHLVMRTGHLWGTRNVTIPVSDIYHVRENVVHLKIDKEAVSKIPSVPIQGG